MLAPWSAYAAFFVLRCFPLLAQRAEHHGTSAAVGCDSANGGESSLLQMSRQEPVASNSLPMTGVFNAMTGDSSMSKVLLAQLKETATASLEQNLTLDNSSKLILVNLSNEIQTDMIQQLLTDTATNQADLNRTAAAIATCNSQMTNSMVNVSALETTVGVRKEAHKLCRSQCLEACANGTGCNSRLDAWLDSLSPPCTIPEDDPLTLDQDERTKPVMLNFFDDLTNWSYDNWMTYENWYENCSDKDDKCNDCENTCRIKQESYELGFCGWVSKYRSTCTTHATCYAAAVAHFIATNTTVYNKERHAKIEYKGLKRIVCLIAVLVSDASSDQRRSDLDTCITKVIDTSPLDIFYPEVPVQTGCNPYSEDSPVPGDNAWYEQEYVNAEPTIPAHTDKIGGYWDTSETMNSTPPCLDL